MIVIVIPAKGDSTRLPKKNMAIINGLPMIDYAIQQALASDKADAIYVSTDSDEIARYAHVKGIEVIIRPNSLGGETPLLDVLKHALNKIDNINVQTVVCLQVDHPDRNIKVDEAIECFARENVDKLYSTEANGTKNGAQFLVSRHYIETGNARSEFCVIDDCTNIHYPEDLQRAAQNLLKR